MKLNDLFIDPRAEQDGVWVTYKGVRWRIARAGNPRFNEVWAAEIRPLLAAHGSYEDIPEEKADAALDKARAEAILVGWDGLEDQHGVPIEYSSATALEILRNPKLGHLARFVEQQSMLDSSYRGAAVAAEAGN